MLSSSLDTLLKLSKTTSPQKLFAYDCVTLYIVLAAYTLMYTALDVYVLTVSRNDIIS